MGKKNGEEFAVSGFINDGAKTTAARPVKTSRVPAKLEHVDVVADHLRKCDVATAFEIAIGVLSKHGLSNADIAVTLRYACNALIDALIPARKTAEGSEPQRRHPAEPEARA